MARAVEKVGYDHVILHMTLEETNMLMANLGGQWSGDHDTIYEALLGRERHEPE